MRTELGHEDGARADRRPQCQVRDAPFAARLDHDVVFSRATRRRAGTGVVGQPDVDRGEIAGIAAQHRQGAGPQVLGALQVGERALETAEHEEPSPVDHLPRRLGRDHHDTLDRSAASDTGE